MNANTPFSSDDLLKQARQQTYVHALFRPESALILSVSILMTGLCVLNIFWFPGTWWMWTTFGVLGVSAIVISSANDPQYQHEIALKIFYERYDKTRLKLPEMKQSVSQALDYHKLLFREISERPHAPLANIALDMDQLVAGIYRVAYMLDAFVADDRIRKYLGQLMEAQQEKQAQSSTVKSPNADYKTVDDYTMALTKFANNDFATNTSSTNEQTAMVDNVCRAVASARDQLKDTLTNISAVHRKVASTATTSTWQGDWSFVDVVHDTFTEYMQGLEDNAMTLDNLYSTCTVAAKGVSK